MEGINFNVLNESPQDQDAFNLDPGDYREPEPQEVLSAPPPIKRDPFDPIPLVGLLAKFEAEIKGMESQSALIEVQDDASNALAVEMTTQAKAIRQKIDKKHAEVKAPYLAVTKSLDGFRKTLSDRIQNNIETVLNNKIRPYLQKKEEERREAERKAREEAEKLQAELEAQAKAEAQAAAEAARLKAIEEGKSKAQAEAEAQAAAAMVEPAPVVVIPDVEKDTRTVTETGTAKLKEEWAWEIVDILSIPPEAFENRWDEVVKALAPWFNAQIKAGIRNLPGVKIFKQAKIDIRVKK